MCVCAKLGATSALHNIALRLDRSRQAPSSPHSDKVVVWHWAQWIKQVSADKHGAHVVPGRWLAVSWCCQLQHLACIQRDDPPVSPQR